MILLTPFCRAVENTNSFYVDHQQDLYTMIVIADGSFTSDL